MKRVNYTVEIKAPAPKVWHTLWDDENYKKWSGVFEKGSHAVTDWQEGSKVLFLSSKGEGMFSEIVKKVPDQYMSFKHLGVVKEGKEEPRDDETAKWCGAMENYILKEKEGLTVLKVEMDVIEDYLKFFNETFPKALEKVKELSEN